MVTYTKPKDRKKEGDRLTGERDKTTFVDHRFEGRLCPQDKISIR